MTAVANAATDRIVQLDVVEVVRETPDACAVVFAPVDGWEHRFTYDAGQFLTLRIPTATGSVARCYSLCSSPDTDERPTIGVKAIPGGVGSNWIVSQLRPGDRVEALPPAGTFGPRSYDHPIVLLGAGSGITPLLAIAKTAARRSCPLVRMLYANNDARSVMFEGQLNRLGAESEQFDVEHWLVDERGFLTVDEMQSWAQIPDAHYYICGPTPFMEKASQGLAAYGVASDNIHIEKFESIEGDPFAALAHIGERTTSQDPAEADSAAGQTLIVHLYGDMQEVPCDPGTSLLESAEAAGLAPPFSCREGRCSACTIKVIDGTVRMKKNNALTADEVDEGYALACQSLPESDIVEIEWE